MSHAMMRAVRSDQQYGPAALRHPTDLEARPLCLITTTPSNRV